jgi:Protein of unknown function (DUF3592)
MWRVSPERLLYWAPRFFLGVGVLLLVVGAVVALFTARFIAGAERADGTVVDLVLSDSGDDEDDQDVVYRPVVRFTTAEGRAVEFVSSLGSSPPSHSKGDSVEVLYDPDDPNDARLSDFLDLWFDALLAGGLGLGFTVVAAYVLRRTRGPSEAKLEALRAHGLRVQGTSPRAVYCTEVDVSGASPFRVEVDVHEPARDEVRVLASDYVWFDPEPYLEGRDYVNVYLDPDDRQRYLVDISFLPRRAD